MARASARHRFDHLRFSVATRGRWDYFTAMPTLHITLPDGSHLDHELTDETVTVGRAPDNTFHLDDVSISSHHAQILPKGDGFILKDLDSTNGTKLNGTAVNADEEYILNTGDKILFGKIEAVFDPNSASEDTQELPELDEHVAPVGKSSAKPSNFMNASPFQKKATKKDSIGIAIFALAAVALLASLSVIVLVLVGMEIKS